VSAVPQPQIAMSVPLVILSDVRLYREGLALNIRSRGPGIEVVGICADSVEVLESVRGHPEAIVLVDTGMADGLAQVRRLVQGAPGVTLLALALAPESEHEIVAAAEAGIGGYIPPEASIEDLVRVVEHAARGEMICSPRVAGTLARRIASLASGRGPSPGTAALTAREREVLELLEIGLSNKQIARRLSIRLATVKNHVHSILAKLNVKRRGEAAAALRGDGTPDATDGETMSRWNTAS
jgi:two-component system, NarL family, nitrate/nitrite response regulator NarL